MAKLKQMRKILLFTLLFLTCSLSFGQNVETAGFPKTGIDSIYYDGRLKFIECYEKGIRTGEWKYYYDNGALEKSGNYENGKRIGEWKWFDKQGKVTGILNYDKGISENYYQNGKLKSKGKNVSSLDKYNETGDFEFYNEFTSNLEAVESLKNGKQVGKSITYGSNEEPIEIGNYENGKLNGEYKKYYYNYLQNAEKKYPKETLKVKGYFKDGKETGEWNYYYENGKIYLIGTYENGAEIGEWKYYDEKGNLIKRQNY